jgi:DNA-binding transcriptional LysR family regulator
MHIDELDTVQIRLLAELLDTRSLSLAARRIGLSQSAASHALARLRTRLGDALFVRASNGVQPTPYGERVGAAARRAVDTLLEGLAADRPFDPYTSTRRFNIYLSDVGQMVLLPKVLAFMKDEAPHASLRTSPIPLDDPGGALGSGEVDLAVGFRFKRHGSCCYRAHLGQAPDSPCGEADRARISRLADDRRQFRSRGGDAGAARRGIRTTCRHQDSTASGISAALRDQGLLA